MKAEHKAMHWLNDNVAGHTIEQHNALTLLLKEQDRDTRHACAEAVLECPEDVTGEWIKESCAHSACMNVKAV